MTFQQRSFLGATISSFGASMGWGRTPSRLSVVLVEDSVVGDVFSPPLVGYPVYFDYGGWQFGGVLQRWQQSRSQSGCPIYTVDVVDPRDLLAGVQLIINGYTGYVGDINNTVPNIYNVYGYYEANFGFGSSGVNDTGTPWELVRDGFLALQLQFPISFRGNYYYVDLSFLPSLPSYYRVGGGNECINLLEFIEEVCDAASHDYFVKLTNVDWSVFGVSNVISIRTIDRTTPADIGKITQFVATVQAHKADSGIELRNETTSKLLVGGPMESVYYVNYSFGENTTPDKYSKILRAQTDKYPALIQELSDFPYPNGHRINHSCYSDTIIPYWGTFTSTGAVIVGDFNPEGDYVLTRYGFNPLVDDDTKTDFEWNPFFHAHTFKVDIYPLKLEGLADRYTRYTDEDGNIVGIPYYTDTMEMRMVLAGQTEWENFLVAINDVTTIDVHYKKARDLKLIQEGAITDILKDFFDKNARLPTAVEIRAAISQLRQYDLRSTKDPEYNDESKIEVQIRKLYEFLRNFAENYYGKKFLVKVPNVLAKVVYDTAGTDNDIIKTSLEPTDSGFLSEDLWDDAVAAGYLPWDVNKFTDDNNKIVAYVRYDYVYRDSLDITKNAEERDVDGVVVEEPGTGRRYIRGKYYSTNDLNEDEYMLWNNSLYLKCTVDKKLVFLNRADLTEPRAVITLSRPVFCRPKTLVIRGAIFSLFFSSHTLTAEERDGLVSEIASNLNFHPLVGTLNIPDCVAIPLKSNVDNYGPWYAIGSAGKTEFEQDTTLVPWNYGGFFQMNLVGNAKVQNIASTYQAGEDGTVTFPDVPGVQLGHALIDGGPYVTDIDVDIGENGATTTYKMQTWTPKFGRMQKATEERLEKMSTESRNIRREVRDFANKINRVDAKGVSYVSTKNMKDVPSRMHSNTIAPLIVGEVTGSQTNVGVSGITAADCWRVNQVITATMDEIDATLLPNYAQKAGGSIDNLMTVFSTDPDDSSFNGPKFVEPDSTDITVEDLNPFKDKEHPDGTQHNFLAVVRGGIIPNRGLVNLDKGLTGGMVRSVGLRVPTILTGWGHDIAGNPVPNANDNYPDEADDEFLEEYRLRTYKWKSGPLDVRWDEDRGVWTGSSPFFIGKVIENDISPLSTGLVQKNDEMWIAVTGSSISVLNPHDITLEVDLKVRWGKYPGWDSWIVEPWHFTTCEEEE